MDGIMGIFLPGPVGLITIVTAFVAEGLFKGPGEVAMPGEKVALQ